MIISTGLFQVLKRICTRTKMMSKNEKSTIKNEYGTLTVDYPFYVEREADTELFEYIKSKRLCYVFNSRKMGKSSLDERVRKKLEKEENFKCVKLALTGLGIDTQLDQWYFSLISNLAKQFELEIGDESQLNSWWEKRRNKTPIDRFKDFIEELLQIIKDKDILIVFDEIDVFISAPPESEIKFSQKDKNAFFSFIRWCYNDADNLDYQRLVFCLIGVISVSDLISEPTMTPFNVGHPIELNGFKLEQAGKLIEKLSGNKTIQNTEQILRDILAWTDGQPFLTQKLCDLVIDQQDENLNIDDLVEREILKTWNSDFYPKYFTRIEEEVVEKNEENLGRRLTLYQQVLEMKENQGFEVNDSREQEQLCLSGLVIKKQGKLKVANQIFLRIFDANWVQKKLNDIRVYPQQRAIGWESTQNKSLLLTGQQLQDAIAWKSRMGFKVEEIDHKFIEASIRSEQVAEQVAEITKGIELKEIILKMSQRLIGKTTNQEKITLSIIEWTNNDLNLIKIICELINSESLIPEGTEREWVQQWIKKNIIDNYQNSPLATKIAEIMNSILDSDRYLWRLQTYQKILGGEGAETIDENDVNALLVSGLVVKISDKLQVANLIYEGIFSQEWVKAYLPPYAQSFTSWQDSGCQDESLLLKGEDLQKAVEWIQNKNELSESELEFIITSLVWDIWSSKEYLDQELKTQAVKIIQKWHLTTKLNKNNHVYYFIQQILEQTKSLPLLLEEVLNQIEQKSSYEQPTQPQTQFYIKQIQKNHAINFLAWLNNDDSQFNVNLLKNQLHENEQQLFDKVQKWLNKNPKLKDYLINHVLNNEVSYETLQRISEKFNNVLTTINELKLLTYDTIRHEVKQSPQLDLIFSKEIKEIKIMALKTFQTEFDELLDNIVEQSKNDLEAIIIFELNEGCPQYHNKKLKETNPNLYSVLFSEVEGEDLGGEAVANFVTLNDFQQTIKTFGDKTGFGTQKYTMVSFEKRKMMVFFEQLDNIPITICFLLAEGTGLASIISRTTQAIPRLREKLKQF